MHVIPDAPALRAHSQQHGISPHNMRHLVGLFVGSNGQSAYVQGWQLLDRLQWIARDDDVAVPVPTVLAAFCARRGLGLTYSCCC